MSGFRKLIHEARWEDLGLQPQFETLLEKRTAMWASSVVPVEPTDLEELRVRLADLNYGTVYSPITRPYLLGLVSAPSRPWLGSRRMPTHPSAP